MGEAAEESENEVVGGSQAGGGQGDKRQGQGDDQEGDPGRAWSWYRWSNLEQNLHYLVISAISPKKLNF